MNQSDQLSTPERLLLHVTQLERLEIEKQEAAARLSEAFNTAKGAGFDTNTLKVVLKLRKMTPGQRKERRALESIYMAALGMLEGEALPEEARRRLDPEPEPETSQTTEPDARPETEGTPESAEPQTEAAPAPPVPAQPALVLKTQEEARQEGKDAAAIGKRIYDNPYPAGDANRAAWDEGWCAQRKSHGMDTPAAFQRRTNKPDGSDKTTKDDKSDGADGSGKAA